MKSRRSARGRDDDGLREIDEELRLHIEGRTQELIAAGLSPADARWRALQAFGDFDAVRGEMRQIEARVAWRRRSGAVLAESWRDVRIGARRLRRSPGHTVVATLTLALGIGASVAMFTVLNAVVLRPLPYLDSDRLIRVWPATGYNIAMSRAVGESLPSITSYTGIAHWSLTLEGVGDATALTAAVVDVGYFDVFGVQPLLGRRFTIEETEPASSGVVLLSHELWQSRFGGNPDIIGRRLRFKGYQHESREVIGVLPPGHQTQGQEADVWMPLHLWAGLDIASDSTWYVQELVARLGPGTTVEQADAETRAIAARLGEDYPGVFEPERIATASAAGLRSAVVGDAAGTLWLLLAAVGLVLLIACGNLANLLLARATGQRREMAVQVALGASRGRLIRQQLAESALIAAAGGSFGIVLARLILAVVHVAQTSGLPRVTDLGVDGRVAGFGAAVTVGTLLLFGLAPALRAAAADPSADLQGTSRGGNRGRGTHRLNRALVAAELAMAMTLATAAGLVLSSFAAVRAIDPGLDTENVLTLRVMPPADGYVGDRLVAYFDQVEQRLAALPGADAVGGIHLLPFTIGSWNFPYLAEGRAPPGNAPLPAASFRITTPGYLRAAGQPLIAGRTFTAADRERKQRVMLINERMARELWPAEDAIGREIRIFGNMPHRVVGVVGDVRQFALEREPDPEMYVPVAQWAGRGRSMVFLLRSPHALALGQAARTAVAAIDRTVPIVDVRPFDEALGESIAGRRFIALVIASFGALALLLGAAGIYGVMSNMIGAHMPDFGIRLALGAERREVLWQALRAGLTPSLIGLALGVATSIALADMLRGLLFGIPPLHAPTYIAAAAVLLVVATAASWIPAWRAARTDPLSVLRAE